MRERKREEKQRCWNKIKWNTPLMDTLGTTICRFCPIFGGRNVLLMHGTNSLSIVGRFSICYWRFRCAQVKDRKRRCC